MLRQTKVAGLSAVGFATMIVLGNLVIVPAGIPRTGTDAAEAVPFFADNATAVAVSSAFAPAAWVFVVLFGAGAVAVLRPGERERDEAWSMVGFAGLLLLCATFTGVIATRLALTQEAAPGLWALHDALFVLNGTFLALGVSALSVAGLRGGLIRPWHAALGLAAGALQFLSATLAAAVIAQGGPLGLLSLVGWLMWVVWLVVFGVRLFRLQPSDRPMGMVSSLPPG